MGVVIPFSRQTRFERRVPANGSSVAAADAGDGGATHGLAGRLREAAWTDASLLLTGGDEAELRALTRLVHEHSHRAERAFVTVDCAQPPDALSAELFGIRDVQLDGTSTYRPGAIERAHGGTLVLARVGELPLEHQKVLARALEDRRFRNGAGDTHSVDVRTVATSPEGLERKMARGEFLRNLHACLAMFERDVSVSSREETRPHETLPDLTTRPLREAKRRALELFVYGYLTENLRRHRGNVAKTAQAAGVSRQFMYRLMGELGLRAGDFRDG